MFHQADLFDHMAPAPLNLASSVVALPDLVERVSQVSKRPRYVLLILNLIAKAAGENGSLGPYVRSDAAQIPVRDWLCQALAPLANRAIASGRLNPTIRRIALRSGGASFAELKASSIATQIFA